MSIKQTFNLQNAGLVGLKSSLLLLFALLTSCGFVLRGTSPLPFDTFYISVPKNTPFGANLYRAIRAASPDICLVSTAKEAQAQLEQISDSQQAKEILLDQEGRVQQYELSVAFTFRVIDKNGSVLLPATTLVVTREVPYDSRAVQAKEGEIDTLYRQMRQSLIQRIIARLTASDLKLAVQIQHQKAQLNKK